MAQIARPCSIRYHTVSDQINICVFYSILFTLPGIAVLLLTTPLRLVCGIVSIVHIVLFISFN